MYVYSTWEMDSQAPCSNPLLLAKAQQHRRTTIRACPGAIPLPHTRRAPFGKPQGTVERIIANRPAPPLHNREPITEAAQHMLQSPLKRTGSTLSHKQRTTASPPTRARSSSTSSHPSFNCRTPAGYHTNYILILHQDLDLEL